jgi:hypothetical protein
MGRRTGIRSGVAPSDVWHLMSEGGVVTACGRRGVRAAVKVVPPATITDAIRRVDSQGGTVCEACLSCRDVAFTKAG